MCALHAAVPLAVRKTAILAHFRLCLAAGELKTLSTTYKFRYTISMKVVVLYRPSSEHARSVEEFATTLEKTSGGKVELVNVDTRDGASTASLYDVMSYPAVLALQNDGQLVRDWGGSTMPLVNEVSYYTHQ